MAELAPGSTFADYLIEGVIAQGGMGVVYRAVDPKLERTVALKVIRSPLAEDEEFRRRFTRESKLAGSLDHPNVVPIHVADEHDGVPFIVMRYVDGHTLRTLVREEGRLSPERAARIVGQIASALDAAHEAGLVHRDVKPANVLLTASDHVYLTDFGLSKRVVSDEDATSTGAMLGTFNWMAPEQIRRESVGALADVYALGCVLFHLLTARHPFPAETEWGKQWSHMFDEPPAPSAVSSDLPRAFDAVVRRAMAKRPEDRYPSAGELAGAAAAATAVARPAGGRRVRPVRGEATARRPSRTAVPPRTLLPRALRDPFALVLLAGMVVAGVLFGAVLVVVGLALYTASVAHAYLDEDVRRPLAEREAARQAPPPAPPPAVKLPGPPASIDELAEEAVEKKEEIQEAIEEALPEVSLELDKFENTIRRSAEGAHLAQEELRASSPEALEFELERLRVELRGVQSKLDSLSEELLSASDATAVGREEQLAAEVRDARIELGEVADDLADAVGEAEDG